MGTKTHRITDQEFADYLRVLRDAKAGMLVFAALDCVIAGTGARIGEALDLAEKDLFDANGKPLERVTRNVEKKRRLYRYAIEFPWGLLGGPVIDWRREAIRRRMILHREDKLFSVRVSGKPLSQRYCREKHAAILRHAGINPRGVAFHGIRKTFLSIMFFQRLREADGDFWGALKYVQELACHESPETTLRYLADCISRRHADTMQAAFLAVSPELASADKR